MKNQEVIILNNVCKQLVDFKPLSYVILRNTMKMKSVVEVAESFEKKLLEDFKTELLEKVQAEIQKQFPDATDDQKSVMLNNAYYGFMQANKEYVEFLNEEVSIDFYKFNLELLEGKEFDVQLINKIVPYFTFE